MGTHAMSTILPASSCLQQATYDGTIIGAVSSELIDIGRIRGSTPAVQTDVCALLLWVALSTCVLQK